MITDDLFSKVSRAFRTRFLREPELVIRAPGRVNLIGEHTDYNDGFVLPTAVDRAAWLAVGKRETPEAIIRALDMGGDEINFPVDRIAASAGGWGDYPRAIVWAFLERGLQPAGLEAVLASNVPVGAGMSSSAAVEMAFAYAWNVLSLFDLPREELALLGQHAENTYVGVNCGIMDQMISACGRSGHALLLDTRTLERRYIPLPDDIAIVVADSCVRRSLAGSEYNVRRAQCEQAVRLLRDAGLEGIQALRDVTPEQLQDHAAALPPAILRRARHVVTENARVQATVAALQEGDLETVGELLKEGHLSLRDDYEVSAPELDLLAETAWEVPGCYGARLTGAGFGGCIIALAQVEAVEGLSSLLTARYFEAFEKEPAVYVVHPADGVSAQ
ncbi:MAG TPA: galactokinase [Anaerolineae bacterium]|nr:MAG: Galactokinase [Chloroflexi bacterium ADurb.Bin222]HOS80188.1 galactokinase [Anaerolineae bacterium]HQJ11787.1 galactokinase [Anaerolineae bacterium]